MESIVRTISGVCSFSLSSATVATYFAGEYVYGTVCVVVRDEMHAVGSHICLAKKGTHTALAALFGTAATWAAAGKSGLARSLVVAPLMRCCAARWWNCSRPTKAWVFSGGPGGSPNGDNTVVLGSTKSGGKAKDFCDTFCNAKEYLPTATLVWGLQYVVRSCAPVRWRRVETISSSPSPSC